MTDNETLPEVAPPWGQPTLPLAIELVPSSSWGNNLRLLLPPPVWRRLAAAQARAAGWVCEVCGGRGPAHPVECHEVWEYDDAAGVQRLAGLVSLCPPCHRVKHIGLELTRGQKAFHRAFAHFVTVNRIDLDTAERAVESAFALHARRSTMEWTLDLDWLRGGLA
jgi:hypothetical protein